MKRQMKLIRKLLQYAEANATGLPIDAPEYQKYSEEEVHYHLGLCSEAGYMRVSNSTYAGMPTPRYMIINLTWQGHEELERLNRDACLP